MKRLTGEERHLKHLREAETDASAFCELAGEHPKLVITCGVGFGNESRIFKRYWPACTVVGVDPLRDIAHYFEGEFVQAVLVSDPDQKTARFFRVSGQVEASTVFRKREKTRYDKRLFCDAITLDAVFDRFGGAGPVALWLDCEGSELEAMRGGLRCLAATEVLLVETTISNRISRIGFPRREQVFAFLQEQGFRQAFERNDNSIWTRAKNNAATH